MHGEVIVKYNHYNKSFPIVDGCLKWETIDDMYAFSYVFQGNWALQLYPEKEKGNYVSQKDKTFEGLVDG